jgi:ABC-type antimicrobial peptide transport system permease subunit
MLKNFFVIAWRNLLKSKGYSSLNILGLAIGMAVALLIGLWVAHEYSYDKFLPDNEQLYQVRRNFNSNGDTLNFTSTSLKLADALRSQVPEIEYVAEGDFWASKGLMAGDKKLYLTGAIAGGDFLKMFGYPLLQGNAGDVLKDPYSIVLTENTARSLFGDKDPIGRTVRIDNKNDLKVTGVLRDLPSNSSFSFKFLVPFSYLEATDENARQARKGSYGYNSFEVYVKLKPGVPYAQVAPKIKDIEKTEKGNLNAMYSSVILQPMRNWHLYGNYINGKETGGFIVYVRLFSIIGGLVLLIACINFVNLTTARSEGRAKEVGVRKAIGSSRQELILQFLFESVLLAFFAFLLCLVMVILTLPAFNALTGADMTIPFSSGLFWLILLGGVLITAIAAGSRPAFYLSSFNPVKVLKGLMQTGRAGNLPRKVLVVLQFTCSVALIISTIIVYQQIQYARQRPTGYNIDRLLMTNMNDDLQKNYPALRDELLRQGLAENVTTATSPATNIYGHADVDKWPGKQAGETIEMGVIATTRDYFKTLGIPLKEGRMFEANSDTASVIFNEMAIRQMRIKDPLNQVITYQGAPLRIIGIAKNNLALSPFSPADPTAFFYNVGPQNVMMYKLSPRFGTEEALAKLTALFNKYNPAFPYTYQFADQEYARKFSLELLVGKLAAIFAGLAIFISCLGLFGMAAYIAEQRTREIGIRKVLGASVSNLCLLLSKDFILLVTISCVIASPIALFFLKDWLQKYDYRVGISPWPFITAAAVALVITLLTISFQAIKAAIANPVKSLKAE